MGRFDRKFVHGCLIGGVLGVVLLLLAVFGAAFLLQDAVVQYKADRLKPPPITTGLYADYGWTVQTLEGAPFNLGATRGKVVFLHVWSPGCMSCMAEIPSVSRLYGEVAANGIEFVCVALGDLERLGPAIAEHGLLFTPYTYAGELPAVFNAGGIPATYIIGPQGEILFKHVNAAKWDAPDVVAYLRTLAATNAPADHAPQG